MEVHHDLRRLAFLRHPELNRAVVLERRRWAAARRNPTGVPRSHLNVQLEGHPLIRHVRHARWNRWNIDGHSKGAIQISARGILRREYPIALVIGLAGVHFEWIVL